MPEHFDKLQHNKLQSNLGKRKTYKGFLENHIKTIWTAYLHILAL